VKPYIPYIQFFQKNSMFRGISSCKKIPRESSIFNVRIYILSDVMMSRLKPSKGAPGGKYSIADTNDDQSLIHSTQSVLKRIYKKYRMVKRPNCKT
jgi:hypothetical protein